MDAALGAEGIVIATGERPCLQRAPLTVLTRVRLPEWDEFKTLDWQKIYDSMAKPAFVFDGRGILPFKDLEKIGFKVFTIGRGDEHQ